MPQQAAKFFKSLRLHTDISQTSKRDWIGSSIKDFSFLFPRVHSCAQDNVERARPLGDHVE